MLGSHDPFSPFVTPSSVPVCFVLSCCRCFHSPHCAAATAILRLSHQFQSFQNRRARLRRREQDGVFATCALSRLNLHINHQCLPICHQHGRVLGMSVLVDMHFLFHRLSSIVTRRTGCHDENDSGSSYQFVRCARAHMHVPKIEAFVDSWERRPRCDTCGRLSRVHAAVTAHNSQS